MRILLACAYALLMSVSLCKAEDLAAFRLFSPPAAERCDLAKFQLFSPIVNSHLVKAVDRTLPANSLNPKPLRKRILMLTAKWCHPCRDWHQVQEPALRKAGWSIGPEPTNQIQTIDIDENPELASRYGEFSAVPTFVLVENGKAKDKRVGNIDSRALLALWNQ